MLRYEGEIGKRKGLGGIVIKLGLCVNRDIGIDKNSWGRVDMEFLFECFQKADDFINEWK